MSLLLRDMQYSRLVLLELRVQATSLHTATQNAQYEDTT